MNPRVVKVKPLKEYKLALTFSNGQQGIFDCSHMLNTGVFKEFSDPEYFSQVRVEAGAVAWPHEQDICPDTLYLDSVKSK